MGSKTSSINVMHVLHNQEIDLYRATVREDKAYMKDEKLAHIPAKAIFTVRDHRGRRVKTFKTILYLDGKSDACQVQTNKAMKVKLIAENQVIQNEQNMETIPLNVEKLQLLPDDIETIFEPLTFKDRVTIVKREIAKQLGKYKPIETWQFVALIGLVVAMGVINLIF